VFWPGEEVTTLSASLVGEQQSWAVPPIPLIGQSDVFVSTGEPESGDFRFHLAQTARQPCSQDGSDLSLVTMNT
jgi:hypothetical protein